MTITTIKRWAALAVALSVTASAGAAMKFYPGVIKRENFAGFGGTAVSDLTGNAKFQAGIPDEVDFLTELESPDYSPARDNYGGRLSGVIIPTTTGRYRFYISGDDQSILYLSTDETPANLSEIAREPAWNGTRDYARGTDDASRAGQTNPGRPGCDLVPADCENESAAIQLTANRQYYFEVLWKEGGGGDHASVTWVTDGEAVVNGPDGQLPIQAANLGVMADDAPTILGGATANPVWAYFGGSTALSVSAYAPPGTTPALQWYKDGVAIAGATGATYTYASTQADAGKTLQFMAKLTAGATVIDSGVATFQVIDPGAAVDSPGFLKMEVWNGLSTSDNSLDNTLLIDERYPASPDFVSYTSSFSSRPVYADDSHEGYGGRISGFIIPAESGDYRFFIYSDDSSRLNLSTDQLPANAFQIAEETACCTAFTEPENPRTSDPYPLVAGRRYYVEGLWKEGTGGDYLNVAWRKEGDTTAAGSLPVIPGRFLLTQAPAGGVVVNFTTQPIASASVEVAKTITLNAVAAAFPINSVSYQWQKDGVDIPGATASSYTLPLVPAADVGKTAKFKLVATSLGSVKASSSEASVTFIGDATPPRVVSAGTVRKGANVEIGVVFDEAVDATSAGNNANYSLSAGTISSVRFVAPKGSKLDPARAVIVATGLTAGQSVTVSVVGVADRAGNAIPAGSPSSKATKVTGNLSWAGVGADEINVEKANLDYSDDVVARGASSAYKDAYDFDLVSGGSGNWESYDEGTFVYEEITGDFDRVVRVEYADPTSQWSRAALSVREALDEGTTREDTVGGVDGLKPMARNLNVRFSTPFQASGAAANNSYEVIDRNITGGVYRGTPGGFGGAPNYPTAWMRISRVGSVFHFWKSDNGTAWTNEGTLNWLDEANGYPAAASKLYVGMFYAPEYNNNEVKNTLTGSAIAAFRDYGAFPMQPAGGGDPGSIAISSAGGVKITWDSSKGGVLQSATAVTGPYTDVAGASSPHTQAAPGYYRLRGN